MKIYVAVIASLLIFASVSLAATVFYYESQNQTASANTAVVSPPMAIPSTPPANCLPGQPVMMGTNGAYCE